MPEFGALGRILIFIGAAVLLVGAALVWAGKIPGMGWIGRLPGDIYIQRKNFSFYFPITTGLVISAVLSLILWLLRK